jgi:hypothetical protein
MEPITSAADRYRVSCRCLSGFRLPFICLSRSGSDRNLVTKVRGQKNPQETSTEMPFTELFIRTHYQFSGWASCRCRSGSDLLHVTTKIRIRDDQDPDPETTLKLGLVTNTSDPDQQTLDTGSGQMIRIRHGAHLQHCS